MLFYWEGKLTKLLNKYFVPGLDTYISDIAYIQDGELQIDTVNTSDIEVFAPELEQEIDRLLGELRDSRAEPR